ncbi:MAG: DUF1993 domain-containing protein [Kofleriaceae bacterium]
MTPYVIVLEMKKVLKNIDGWLAKAEAHATAKKFDTTVLMQARLAPDQFAFARQIQSACDTAKLAASRLTGKEAPSHADTETTFAELSARIGKVIAYLDTFSEADFNGVEDRKVTTPRWEGKSMTAIDYFAEHAIPNFFFHTTTAYAILRHNGVDVGKRDYLGPLSLK